MGTAHKPAHGSKVDKAAGGVGVGFVLADDAAHGLLLQDEGFEPAACGVDACAHAGRAGAYDDDVVLFHGVPFEDRLSPLL